ncbi:glycosyltransferase family 2 protein [uncultured Algibacter sp.]|uniref:glycosyltransferase family 2 protein n=1 Tax=uncultured Algibacter sp. TaxID=298659 RepID=UPI002639D7C3|nr:glycosyltransferase family 2 protein [uncultured Algibacter sp.]
MLLSIITINYNDKSGLERTIHSVMNQSYTNFEHIIIDGGSNDGSRQVIEANQQKFSYWVSEPDNGIYHAMNKGIKAAKGSYLLFLNGGDHFIDNNALNKVYSFLKDVDIVYFNINVVAENKTHVKTCPKNLTFKYLHENLPAHQATFIKKSLFNKLGYYDENLKIVSDWKFLILAICKHNATYKYIEDTFSTYYSDGLSSLNENQALVKAEREQVLNTDFKPFMNDLKARYMLERTIRTLRKSNIIKLLIKLRLIHEF